MKNTFKFLGIAALMVVIVFSMLSCNTGGGGSSSSAKYTAAIFSVLNDDFDSAFDDQTRPVSGGFKILAGDPEILLDQAYEAYFAGDILADDDGLSLSQVEKAIDDYLLGTYITSAQKTQIMNELKSKEYCVAVVDIGGGKVGIAAAYREDL